MIILLKCEIISDRLRHANYCQLQGSVPKRVRWGGTGNRPSTGGTNSKILNVYYIYSLKRLWSPRKPASFLFASWRYVCKVTFPPYN